MSAPAADEERATGRKIGARGAIAWMAKNPVASNVLMLILMVGGVGMLLSRVKYELFPEVELDTVVVTVAYPGASPAEVEQGVVLAVEEAVRGIDGVKEVRSTALESSASIQVDLLLGTDQDRALNDVKSAVDRITSLPQEAERPVIALASNKREVVSIVVHGPFDEATLRNVAEDVRRGLLADPEITYVELSGVRPLEISVEVPQESLRRHDLTLERVAAAISAGSVELPGGGVRTPGGEVLLRTDERRDRGSEFGEIAVRSAPDGTTLRVRDIATVQDGFQESDYAASFNGEPAAMVKVFRVGDETPISVSDAVQRYLDEARPSLPEGMQLSSWNDTSEMYRQRIDLLSRNGLAGLALVLLILGLFLEPRLAFWVTLGIPTSFLGSLLLFPSAEVSVNMISLFGFIVVLGMVVDDAIVVAEAVFHRRQLGDDPITAAIRGTKEVAVPVVFSVLTTCVAFSPLLFVPGLMGKFFRNVPLVVISVLLFSLVDALFVVPAHLSHRMPRLLEWFLRPFIFVMERASPVVDRALDSFVRRVYEPFARKAIEWRYLTIAAAATTLLFIFGLIAGGRLEFTFFPKIEGDIIVASLRMPVGTPVEETGRHHERMIEAAEEILREVSPNREIRRGIFAELGAASSMDRHTSGREGGHLATVMLYLVPIDDRPISSVDFANRWRERVGDIPGAENLTFRYSIGASPGQPIDVQLSHGDRATLDRAAERLAEALRSYGGLSDIDNGVAVGKEQLSFQLTELGRAHGLTELELARQVRSAFYGAEAVRQQRGRDEVRVFVRRPLEERRSLEDIEGLIVRTPSGGEIPLHQAARVVRGRAYTAIEREDGQRKVSVTADVVEGQANANEVVDALSAEELPKLMRDFPGLSYSMGGEQQEQADSLGALKSGFMMALVVMYGLLAIVFRSYLQPALIMVTIPFGIVGAVLGHVVMGYTLSLMTMMGIVALSGVVVNDSIVLIDAVNEFRRAPGVSLVDAVIQGGARRFRPILLTSATTFLGLAPMILETSVQARFLIPMAISLGFGVLFATVITLIIVPALYMVLEDVRSRFKPSGRLPRAEPREAGEPAEEEREKAVGAAAQ